MSLQAFPQIGILLEKHLVAAVQLREGLNVRFCLRFSPLETILQMSEKVIHQVGKVL